MDEAQLKYAVDHLTENNFTVVFGVVEEIYDAWQMSDDPDYVYIAFDRKNPKLKKIIDERGINERSGYAELRERTLDYLTSIGVFAGYGNPNDRGFTGIEFISHVNKEKSLIIYWFDVFRTLLLERKLGHIEHRFDSKASTFYWQEKGLHFQHSKLTYWIFRLTYENLDDFVSFGNISEKYGSEINPKAMKRLIDQLNIRLFKELGLRGVLIISGEQVKLSLPNI